MITLSQIKAARALLDWTQRDLARATRLHPNAITKIEKGHTSPRQSTMTVIQKALEQAGIRFNEDFGVELRREGLQIAKYAGPDFMYQVNQDVLLTVRDNGDEVLDVFHDESLFNATDPAEAERFVREKARIGFPERIIVPDDYDSFFLPKTDYRCLSRQDIGLVSWVVYKNKFALINWLARESIIIRSQALSDTFRRQFNFLWQKATPVRRKSKQK
ncbi:MAG: helix-turn-helix transcriptional regulator [Patescibacteria group bacterium]